MIQNYDKFLRWNAESGRIYTLWNFHIYSTMINTKHVIYRGNYMYFYKQVAKDFIQKLFHMKMWKRIKKDSQSFSKVISFPPFYVLAPSSGGIHP
jgi:hypothetical protein